MWAVWKRASQSRGIHPGQKVSAVSVGLSVHCDRYCFSADVVTLTAVSAELLAMQFITFCILSVGIKIPQLG